MASFKPNDLTFEEGVQRIENAKRKAGVDLGGRVITSQDQDVVRAVEALTVTNVPDGFEKFQLPFFMAKPTQIFISVAEAGSEVPRHSHTEGDAFRYIVSGSLTYDGKTLGPGDWMLVPKDEAYALTILEKVTMLYCYECCCA